MARGGAPVVRAPPRPRRAGEHGGEVLMQRGARPRRAQLRRRVVHAGRRHGRPRPRGPARARAPRKFRRTTRRPPGSPGDGRGASCDGLCRARPRANALPQICRGLEDRTESASAAHRRAGSRTRRETSPCAPQCNQWRSVDGIAFRPRATTVAAATASEGPRRYYGRGATSSIVPTHVFRPRTGAQGAQRDAGGRVRIDDGGSNDLRLLRRPPSTTTTPATQSARPWDPSTSRDAPTVSAELA